MGGDEAPGAVIRAAALLAAALLLACSEEDAADPASRPADVTMGAVTSSYLAAPAPPAFRPGAFPVGATVSDLGAHSGRVPAIAFSPDGLLLASAGYEDYQLRLWDAEALEARSSARVPDRPTSLAFLGDGSIVTADAYDHVRVWPVAEASIGNARTLEVEGLAVDLVAASPNGRLVATTAWENAFAVWSLGEGRPVARFASPDPLRAVAFHPSGRSVAVGCAKGARVTVWDLATGEGRHWPIAKASPDVDVMGVAWSPDARWLAATTSDTTMAVWDASTGRQVQDLFVQGAAAQAIAFAPDGTLFATGHVDGAIRLWDPATGALRGLLAGHGKPVLALAFHPEGKSLASADESGQLRLWR